MVYQLKTEPIGAYSEHFDCLDGDPRKITNHEQRKDPFADTSYFLYPLQCGRPIDPTHLPTRLQPYGRRHKIGDMIDSIVGFLVSEKAKEIIETFEPGVHAFYPVTFEWKSGQIDEGRYVWIIQSVIQSLHPELIEPPHPGPNARWEGALLSRHPNRKIVFSSERIKNSHVWLDPHLLYNVFVSDAFSEELISSGVSGFSPGNYYPDV